MSSASDGLWESRMICLDEGNVAENKNGEGGWTGGRSDQAI